jgi:hypothetical protein
MPVLSLRNVIRKSYIWHIANKWKGHEDFGATKGHGNATSLGIVNVNEHVNGVKLGSSYSVTWYGKY